VYKIEHIGFIDEYVYILIIGLGGTGNKFLETMLDSLYAKNIECRWLVLHLKSCFHFYKSFGFTPEGMCLYQKKKSYKKKKRIKQ